MEHKDYYRLKKLNLTKAEVSQYALDRAFDPQRAYKALVHWEQVKRLLEAYEVVDVNHLQQILQSNKKPLKGA